MPVQLGGFIGAGYLLPLHHTNSYYNPIPTLQLYIVLTIDYFQIIVITDYLFLFKVLGLSHTERLGHNTFLLKALSGYCLINGI